MLQLLERGGFEESDSTDACDVLQVILVVFFLGACSRTTFKKFCSREEQVQVVTTGRCGFPVAEHDPDGKMGEFLELEDKEVTSETLCLDSLTRCGSIFRRVEMICC